MASLMALVIFGLFILLGCGKDRMNPVSGGNGIGFDIETGPALTQEEFGNALDLSKATAGLTNAAAGDSANAGFALQGMSFAEQAFSTLLNVVNKGNLLDKISVLAKPSDEITVELGNGISIIVTRTEVTEPTDGIELTWVLNGTCTANPNISFNNKEVLTGFISNNYRNGIFRYNHGDLFAAVFCGFEAEIDISGEYEVEWAIDEEGRVRIFVDLDFIFSEPGTTVDYEYMATIIINPDGSGSAKGTIKGSLTTDGITQNFDNSFDVTWS